MTKYKYYFYGLLTLLIYLAGYFTHVKIHTCPIPEVRIDTVYTEIGIQDSTGYEPQLIIFEKPVNEDSIYEAAKLWWQSQVKPDTKPTTADGHLYIASKDTTYDDSLLQANIQFRSRIVLDPEAYFNLKFKVRERTITETVHVTEQVTYNPNFFIEGGGKVGTEFRYYLNAGIYVFSFRHIKMPLYYEYQVVPEGKPVHSMKFGTRIEF